MFMQGLGGVYLVPTFVLRMVGLQWTRNETELLSGMPWEGRLGALGGAGVELIFSIAAPMVLCFGVVTKPVLIKH